MARVDDVLSRRMQHAVAAATRWQERTAERTGMAHRYAKEGPLGADTAERVRKFSERESLRRRRDIRATAAGFPSVNERKIGETLDFQRFAPDEEARRAGLPVARIVEMPQAGTEPQGFGSGFLISPNLLMTNHHVLPTKAEAHGVGANFGYEYASRGLLRGTIFGLDPDTFFLADEDLDFAIVAVTDRSDDGTRLSAFNFVRMIEAVGKILVGQPISIIQYPEGGPKQYATTQNKLLDVLDTGFLHYATDTLEGSSGSPAFNSHWELVALHHSGVPMMVDGKVIAVDGRVWDSRTMGEDEVQWVANEGVRVSGIINRLKSVHLGTPAEQKLLSAVLDSTADPLEAASMSRAPRAIDQLPPDKAITIGGGDMSSVTINIANANIYIDSTTTEKAAAPKPNGKGPERAVEKKIRFDPDYTHREGYKANFLKVDIPLPAVDDKRADELLLAPNGKPRVLKYHHFSLVMNESRRFQMWSAVNVDYTPSKKSNKSRDEFGTDTWIPDPRIAGDVQVQDEEFYKPATKIDRGHIVRREDNAWGDSELEIEYANADTFHWTNCTPQHEAFNQDRRAGLWGQLEVHITKQIGAVDNRASIFAGPVLDPHDPRKDFGSGSIQYPLNFWKVVAAIDSDTKQLQTFGFVLSQRAPIDRFGLEGLDFAKFEHHQVSLSDISDMTGVIFPQVLLDSDVKAGQEPSTVERLGDVTHSRRRDYAEEREAALRN